MFINKVDLSVRGHGGRSLSQQVAGHFPRLEEKTHETRGERNQHKSTNQTVSEPLIHRSAGVLQDRMGQWFGSREVVTNSIQRDTGRHGNLTMRRGRGHEVYTQKGPADGPAQSCVAMTTPSPRCDITKGEELKTEPRGGEKAGTFTSGLLASEPPTMFTGHRIRTTVL